MPPLLLLVLVAGAGTANAKGGIRAFTSGKAVAASKPDPFAAVAAARGDCSSSLTWQGAERYAFSFIAGVAMADAFWHPHGRATTQAQAWYEREPFTWWSRGLPSYELIEGMSVCIAAELEKTEGPNLVRLSGGSCEAALQKLQVIQHICVKECAQAMDALWRQSPKHSDGPSAVANVCATAVPSALEPHQRAVKTAPLPSSWMDGGQERSILPRDRGSANAGRDGKLCMTKQALFNALTAGRLLTPQHIEKLVADLAAVADQAASAAAAATAAAATAAAEVGGGSDDGGSAGGEGSSVDVVQRGLEQVYVMMLPATVNELRQSDFDHFFPARQAQVLFKHCDINHDGRLDKEEFVNGIAGPLKKVEDPMIAQLILLVQAKRA